MRPRLIFLLLLLGATGLTARWIYRHQNSSRSQSLAIAQAVQRFSQLEAETADHDASTWKSTQNLNETDAWVAQTADQVMNSSNRWQALESITTQRPNSTALLAEAKKWQAAGWLIERLTARPSTSTGRPTLPATQGSESTTNAYTFELLLARGLEHAELNASFTLAWSGNHASGTDEPPIVAIDPKSVTRRQAPTQFRPWLDYVIPVPAHTFFVDPLLFRETPQGPELLLISAQLRLRILPHTNGTVLVQELPFPRLPPDRALAAALGDLDGDGWADLWVAGRDGLWIARGRADGSFSTPDLRWRSPEPLIYPQSLTIADVDRDGDLDVWLTQYKNPYQLGQFPTPYYDANDGFPSYLLRNDGVSGFIDFTSGSGLASKRFRRTYSASFVDFDGDGAPDLVNVSDFAGVDLYHNNGHGQFADVTAGLGESRHAFGMAHLVIDRNSDSFPDLLLVGMDSGWASRLDRLGLGRTDFPEYTRQRSVMTAGNRLFLGAATGLRVDSSPSAHSLAHAGWAWGVAELDVENDGKPDYYFANGHETRASQRDYERQFWLHDLYLAGSTNNQAADLYFRSAAARRAAEQRSYGGWHHQALFQDQGTNGFVESAWILGAALLADGRNVIAADFDGDGRMDLAVTTVEGWPKVQQRLVIFRNESPVTGHWLGLRFTEGLGRKSPLNTRVEVRTPQGIRRRWRTTGDSYRSQQTAQVHFGLGANDAVGAVTIYWSDGSKLELPHPKVDQWLEVP